MTVNRTRRLGSYAPSSARYYEDDAIIDAGEAAELLFLRGNAFCAGALNDGLITDRQLPRGPGVGMANVVERAQRLVEVGLWLRVEGGYRVRSFLKWNRSKAEIEEHQAKDRQRKASGADDSPDPPDPPDPVESKRIPRGNLGEAATDPVPADSAGSPNGFRAESARDPFRAETDPFRAETDPFRAETVGNPLGPPTDSMPRAGARGPESLHSTPLHDREVASQPPPRARGGGSRERVTPAELDATAHGAPAHAIVSAWAADRGLLRPQQRELSKAVDDLIRQGADASLVPAALDAAHDDPRWEIPAKALRFAYEHVVRQQRAPQPAASRPGASPARRTTDDKRAAIPALVDEVYDRAVASVAAARPDLRALPGG